MAPRLLCSEMTVIPPHLLSSMFTLLSMWADHVALHLLTLCQKLRSKRTVILDGRNRPRLARLSCLSSHQTPNRRAGCRRHREGPSSGTESDDIFTKIASHSSTCILVVTYVCIGGSGLNVFNLDIYDLGLGSEGV
ncbi:uncharacterized protein LY79DRAFT_229150 [Colletotrichum navitas]|uniref:Uncharacterized protein n=1 Tax=Colletotrichum navitas TaxID=681940 RepID=A0AAD8PXR7_9PEZI|nr:uncharacterized protein LY79DRAFT_229150 [Colletotrichum navitas]KAK1590083.1 hypothetical protein LY79DRAFT_229150 [Colletotrichum navitas]